MTEVDATMIGEADTGAPGRPDAAAQRRQVFIDVARNAFFEHGYAGATMSSIAAAVGGSKTTLWTYFPSKEALFAAVVDDIVEQYGTALAVELSPEEDLATTLRTFGGVLVTMLLSKPMLSLYRLVVSEAGRFPDLAALFYERGPRRGKARLAAFFAAMMERGKMRRGDPMRAVHDYVGLCQSRRHQFALLGLDAASWAEPLDDEIDAVVDSFLRAWGAD